MKIMFSAVLSIALLFVAVAANARRSLGISSLPPPMIAPVRPVVDAYHGTKVEDPYRYMENSQDPVVQSWFKSQNDYADALLARISGRQKVLDRITELDRTRAPFWVGTVARLPGGVHVYPKRLASETVDKLYLRKGLNGAERQLIDPEKIVLIAPNHAKGRNVISDFAVSDDGRYIAVGITPGGAEADTELHVIDLSSGLDTGETLWAASGRRLGNRTGCRAATRSPLAVYKRSLRARRPQTPHRIIELTCTC
jgi:prolyl oligopeptidase